MKRLKKLIVLALMTMPIISNAQTVEEAMNDLDGEKFGNANKKFAQIAQTNPSAANLFNQGYAILKAHDGTTAQNIKLAEELFTKGNNLDKKDPYCQIGLGEIKLANKDAAGAKAIFEAVKSQTKSKNSDVLYRIAEAYTMFPAANDPAQAIMDIDMALEKSKAKDNPDYYIVKSDAYMLKNEGGDAMNALQNAERLNKKKGKIYARMARVWLQGRNKKEALDAINKGIAADPTFAPIYRYQSSYYQTVGNYGESAVAAKKYLDNSDGDCKAKLRYAKLAFVAKDFANVKSTINEIKSCNTDPYVTRMEGIMAFEDKNPTGAIELLRNFIAKAPAEENTGLDYGYIGRSYLSMSGEGDVKRANDSLGIINIEKAVAMNDSSFNYYGDIASTALKNKNFAMAAKYSEKDLLRKKAPNAADFATVGSYFAYSKDYVKADDYIDKALASYKDTWADGYPLSARMKTYKNNADSSSTYSAQFMAAPLYEKYLSLIGDAGKVDPKNKRNVTEALRYLAGREYQVNHNIPKASEFLTEIIKIDPTNKEAQAQLDAINGVKPAPAPVAPSSEVASTGTPAKAATATKPVVPAKPAGAKPKK